MSNKELVAVTTHPCRGFVTTEFKPTKSILMKKAKLESLNLEEIFPEVQHFSDGSTRVLCGRVMKEDDCYQYCGPATDTSLYCKLKNQVANHQGDSCPYAIRNSSLN